MKLHNPFSKEPDISLFLAVVTVAICVLAGLVYAIVLFPPAGAVAFVAAAVLRIIYNVLTGK